MATSDGTEASEFDDASNAFCHIVAPASVVAEAYVTGSVVTALCGKTWTPSKNPEQLPVCRSCRQILEEARAGRDEGQT